MSHNLSEKDFTFNTIPDHLKENCTTDYHHQLKEYIQLEMNEDNVVAI